MQKIIKVHSNVTTEILQNKVYHFTLDDLRKRHPETPWEDLSDRDIVEYIRENLYEGEDLSEFLHTESEPHTVEAVYVNDHKSGCIVDDVFKNLVEIERDELILRAREVADYMYGISKDSFLGIVERGLDIYIRYKDDTPYAKEYKVAKGVLWQDWLKVLKDKRNGSILA